MKKIRSLVVLIASMLLIAGCSGGNTAKNEDIITEITEDTTVVFWHAMTGNLEEALEKLTNDFMAENPKIKVELQNQTGYAELQQKLSATYASPKDLPTITQAYSNWIVPALSDGLLQDLTPYMTHVEIGLEDADDMVQGFIDGGKMDDGQYGFPFSKSSEVLFYNKDLFKKAGVEVPTTMEEFETVAKTIYEKTGVTGAGFDSLNNYYTTLLKNKGVDFEKEFDPTSAESLEVVNYYKQGIVDGYFRIAGTDKFLSGPFSSEQVAFYVGSTAGESFVHQGVDGKFKVGVAPLPVEINIQQGTDIFMFESAEAAEKTAAFEFMKFLASPESQLFWAQETGYIPVRQSVLDGEEYQGLESMVAPIAKDITKEVYTITNAPGGNAAYNEIPTMLEEVLIDKDSDVEAILETFKTTLDGIWD